MVRIYGTLTSPYVRRVRIVAAELGVPVELVNPGAAGLVAVTPIWKMPVADLDGRRVFDSHVIVAAMIARYGWGPLRPDPPALGVAGELVGEALDLANLYTVIDGALDAAINVFYLVRRDGADPELPYLRKQADRVGSALGWLENAVRGASIAPGGGFGLPEIGLLTALGWMAFREAHPVDAYPKLRAFVDHHRDRPSLVATVPTEG